MCSLAVWFARKGINGIYDSIRTHPSFFHLLTPSDLVREKLDEGQVPEDIELTRRGDDSRQSIGVGANDTSLGSFKENQKGGFI